MLVDVSVIMNNFKLDLSLCMSGWDRKNCVLLFCSGGIETWITEVYFESSMLLFLFTVGTLV